MYMELKRYGFRDRDTPLLDKFRCKHGSFLGSRICSVTIQGVIRWDPTQRNFQNTAINTTTLLRPTGQSRWYT